MPYSFHSVSSKARGCFSFPLLSLTLTSLTTHLISAARAPYSANASTVSQPAARSSGAARSEVSFHVPTAQCVLLF